MLIFLFGTDTFRSSEKLAELKAKYFEKNSSGTDLSILDYEDNATIKPLGDILATRGLFSSKQFVLVKNIMTIAPPEQQKEVLNFLKANEQLKKDDETILIFFEAGAPKKNGALYKFLFTNASKQEFAPLENLKLAAWAKDYASGINPQSSFLPSALNLLLVATGNDLWILSNEITKLVNFTNGRQITNDEVVLLVNAKVNSTMFETIEALASGNKARALELFHQQIAKGEDVYYILSMYTYQIRTLLKIGDFYWQGMTSAPQIAQASGIHPYVIQKSLAQLRNLSEAKTKQMLRDLAQIDQDAKTGKVDPLLALDTFIVGL